MDYSKGAEHCLNNHLRLITSANFIFNDEDGTDSFGLYLYYIAFEEISKAIFCLFVEKKWVSVDFIKTIFEDHKPKVLLYDEIFQSFKIKKGIPYLDNKPLGEIPLEDFIKKHKTHIRLHRNELTDFVYVRPDETDWHLPHNTNDLEIKKRRINSKINDLGNFYHLLKKQIKENTTLDGLTVYSSLDGQSTIQWDEI